MLARYSKVINYLLETYATDNVSAKMDTKVLQLAQRSNMALTEYADDLLNKALHCDVVYDKYGMKGIFNEGLHGSIRHSISSYCSSRKAAAIYDLPRPAASMTDWQHGLQTTESPYSIGNSSSKERLTEERREIIQPSPISTKDLHQAPRHSRRRRYHYRLWHSRYPTPMPVNHRPLHRQRPPTMPHFVACVSAGHTYCHAATLCLRSSARSL